MRVKQNKNNIKWNCINLNKIVKNFINIQNNMHIYKYIDWFYFDGLTT
jgi:hypothetical protein